MALDGRLCLSLRPKGYHAQKEKLANDEEVKKLEEVVRSVEEMCKKNASSYLNIMNSGQRDKNSDRRKDNYQSYDGDDDSEEEDEDYRDPLEGLSSSDSETGEFERSLKASNNPFDLLADND